MMAKRVKPDEVLTGLFEPEELREMAAQEEKKKAKKKAPSKDGDVVQRCIKSFYAAYVRRHNPLTAEQWLAEMDAHVPLDKRTTPQASMILPMIKGGKDGALVKKMLATWGEERVLKIIDAFFGEAYTMFGVINSNQDIGALFMVAPKILVRDHAVMPSRKTASNLEAAARAMGRRSPNLSLAMPKRLNK
jgi:hypothetical protein